MRMYNINMHIYTYLCISDAYLGGPAGPSAGSPRPLCSGPGFLCSGPGPLCGGPFAAAPSGPGLLCPAVGNRWQSASKPDKFDHP